jgi:hypothetical protein
MTTPTNELIKKHFNYLINDYGFSIDREEHSTEQMGNAYIVYVSRAIAIMIVVDRSQVLLNLGEPSWPEREWFEFTDVVSFFNSSITEVYNFSESPIDHRAYVEKQVQYLAYILRVNCEPLLRGDFSMQNQIREIEQKRVLEMLESFHELSDNK